MKVEPITVLDGPEVLPCITGDIDGYALNLVCPSCGSHYTHIGYVGTIHGSDPHEAGMYAGTMITRLTNYRRSGVEIVCSCEYCDYDFALVVQQHKGVNYLEVHKLGRKPTKDCQRDLDKVLKG